MTFAVGKAQTTPSFVTRTLVAGTAQTIVEANKWLAGARILNWTAAPVYLALGTAGTPPAGAPSDFIPRRRGACRGSMCASSRRGWGCARSARRPAT